MPASAPALRPPAVPLVVCDPYLSIWSFADKLAADNTKHWTGTIQPLTSIVRVDGKVYRLMGPASAPELPQVGLEVWPTRTIYRFQGAGIAVTLKFTTPALPDDLDLMSRPITYITWELVTVDGGTHDVIIYFDVGAALAVNTQEEKVVWGRLMLPDRRQALYIGSKGQEVLGKAGDNLRIDWGYLYAMAATADGVTADGVTAAGAAGEGDCRGVFTVPRRARQQFVQEGTIPGADAFDMPQQARLAGIAYVVPAGTVGGAVVSRTILLAYDDQYAVEFLHRRLRPYWRRTGWNAADLLSAALEDWPAVDHRCREFDEQFMGEMTACGGEKYARLCALTYRQCLGAHKLVADVDGAPLFFPKENFSNGCIGTVDVIYPTSPFYLYFHPQLLKAALQPVLEYASLPRWPFPFAPHDIGTYPLANGQVYGGGERSEVNQMPVEESGNMLLMVAALAILENDIAFAARYADLLRRWARYLKEKGFDPENQLCTDDFAGHMEHNANLSIKAILALAAYGKLCAMLGESAEAAEYDETAKRYARLWMEQADDGDHYRLAFDQPGTWSQKYNLVWDELLDLKVFPPEVARKEIAFYMSKLNEYGLPLDNRSTWTKLDWCLWTASLAEKEEDFQNLLAPVYEYINRTPSRVPLSDWYFSDSGRQRGFQARSVVGGVFIKALLCRDKHR